MNGTHQDIAVSTRAGPGDAFIGQVPQVGVNSPLQTSILKLASTA